MANFLVNTDVVYLGDAQIIESVECIMDKPRSFGSAVKLVDDGRKSYAFSFKAADVAAAGDFGGVIVHGVNYSESGKAIEGKSSTVVTKGRVLIKAGTGLTTPTFGQKVYVTAAGEFVSADANNFFVGTVCSKLIKAQSLENSNLVDAVYVSVGE